MDSPIVALKAACDGDLDRVRMCLRLEGFIASADEFTQQSTVMNGASDFMVEVFGDVGRHSRIAVGVNTLPPCRPKACKACPGRAFFVQRIFGRSLFYVSGFVL